MFASIRARDKNRKIFVLHEAWVVELQFNAIWYDQYKLVNCTKTKKIKWWQPLGWTQHTQEKTIFWASLISKEKVCTFVPKSVSAIAILFLAISKLGEIVKHLYYSKIMAGAFQVFDMLLVYITQKTRVLDVIQKKKIPLIAGYCCF